MNVGFMRKQKVTMSTTYSGAYNAFALPRGGTSITKRGAGQWW
jgi:hypothetical protein